MVSAKKCPLIRGLVASPVCHHQHHAHRHGGRRGLRPGPPGRVDTAHPFELVDAILDETGRGERRLRLLPSRVGVHYVLALGLFPELSCIAAWRQLTASIGPLTPKVSPTALRHLRRRLTPAPFKALFETLAVPLAPPTTPGVSYRHWRTVAFDGCYSIKAPDSARARGWLGKIRYRLAWAGYPTVMLMTLVETGTRGPAAQFRHHVP
ncbi:transposase domain-containing protein [Streptomyces sp. NBC_01431]|uniref:transposase domain-containing protein n=1 Tax=Streptomyces sp. NBC_01431 TaxID=2903863 RepID=UPI002E3554CE|nr:transposase domain-containing protein [Streptomyces sp. NBC_01431]